MNDIPFGCLQQITDRVTYLRRAEFDQRQRQYALLREMNEIGKYIIYSNKNAATTRPILPFNKWVRKPLQTPWRKECVPHWHARMYLCDTRNCYVCCSIYG